MNIIAVYAIAYLFPLGFAIVIINVKLGMTILQLIERHRFHFKIGNVWISSAGGDCFAPAVQIRNHSCFELILRTQNWRETSILMQHDKSLNWNSDHLAVWLGDYHPGDERYGYPDVYEYNGCLGHHRYL